MESAARGADPEDFGDKHVIEGQNTFCRTIRKAAAKGMKVNTDKMAMVCVSGAQSYVARSHIYDADGTKVSSVDEMKVLGSCYLPIPRSTPTSRPSPSGSEGSTGFCTT